MMASRNKGFVASIGISHVIVLKFLHNSSAVTLFIVPGFHGHSLIVGRVILIEIEIEINKIKNQFLFVL